MKSCKAKNNIWTPSAARPGLLICSTQPAATRQRWPALQIDEPLLAAVWNSLIWQSLIFPAQVFGSSLPSLPLALCLADCDDLQWFSGRLPTQSQGRAFTGWRLFEQKLVFCWSHIHHRAQSHNQHTMGRHAAWLHIHKSLWFLQCVQSDLWVAAAPLTALMQEEE